MAESRIIKKYPNRRLYDTEISSYITLEEVRQLVVDGEKFGFMGSYLEKSLQVFLDQQQQFRSQLNNIMGRTPWSMLNEMTERNVDVWKSMQQGFLTDAVNKARQDTDPAKAKKDSKS